MALVSIGDKIGLSAPTVGDSNDLWGGEQNSNTFPQLDELAYAPREDRNLVIFGGGKISWNASTNQISFTVDIKIYNHITANIVTITTAASPITLDATQKVAYVSINRKPASNQSITSATIVAAGSLPNSNSDADSGVLVLFFRTSESTIMVPWARKELVDGDHWTFGMAATALERSAISHRPAFKSNASDTSQVIVPASSNAPSSVFIEGKLYVNVAQATLDLDTTGRNGLDAGVKAANTLYYLYAIPASSGRTFDIICSTTAPSGAGPSGFTSTWSYLGAFGTGNASAVVSFHSANGTTFCYPESSTNWEVTVNSATESAKTLLIPTTAKAAYLRSNFSSVNAIGNQLLVGSIATHAQAKHTATSTTASQNNQQLFWADIVTPQTIYATTGATWSNAIMVVGWLEIPTEFK